MGFEKIEDPEQLVAGEEKFAGEITPKIKAATSVSEVYSAFVEVSGWTMLDNNEKRMAAQLFEWGTTPIYVGNADETQRDRIIEAHSQVEEALWEKLLEFGMIEPNDHGTYDLKGAEEEREAA